jgi:hypothetical protein
MPPRVRRSSTVRRGISQRRKLEWADFSIDSSTGVGNVTWVDVLSSFAALPGASTAGATVARWHIYLAITSAVVNGDGISLLGRVDDINEVVAGPGIAVVTAHIPSGTETPNADWMLFDQRDAHPGYNFLGPNNLWQYDIRAKRRLKEMGDTLLFGFENRDATATVTWHMHSRALLMMP